MRKYAADAARAVFIALIFILGGASRADAPSQILVRLVAIAALGGAAIWLRRGDFDRIRVPVALLAALIGLMLLQLVPLPPAIWSALPGRSELAQLAPLTGMAEPWRPLSMAPDATINAALSALIPLATILVFASLDGATWFSSLCALFAMICTSALAGVLQVSSGADLLYLYSITNADAAVGLFANRNHQATLLAMSLPIMAVLAVYPLNRPLRHDIRKPVAVMIALLMIPLILITGSKNGLALLVLAAISGWFIATTTASARHVSQLGRSSKKKGFARLTVLLPIGGAIVITMITVFLTRAEAIQRVFTEDVSQEQRFRLFSPMVGIASRYFPTGIGFGAFPDVFKIYEPFDNLHPAYWNHAHNDPLEFLIESGLGGIIILVLFFIWWAKRTVFFWGPSSSHFFRDRLLGRLGSIMVAMMAIASLSDYPLRTPIISMTFAIACLFLCLGRTKAFRQQVPD